MTDIRFHYPAEKLGAARRILMLPVPVDETEAFCEAFDECRRGLEQVQDHMLEPNALRWITTIRGFLNAAEVGPESGAEVRRSRVAKLSYVERDKFAGAVDNLADWLIEAALRG